MKYDLVFEGGGAKGFVLVGAYDEFVKRGHTHGRLLGTSAGAISAAFLAAGYTTQEMLDALNERDAQGHSVLASFLGEPAPFTPEQIRDSAIRRLLKGVDVTLLPDFLEDKLDDTIARLLAQDVSSRHLFSFVERGGWFSADKFVTWLQAKLDAGQWRGGQRNFSKMTLSQFFAATQVEFAVVASDTSGGRMLVLNHQTAPDCPLVMAVRMSMSIPLLWEEVIWQDNWGTYRGRDITGHAIVDGGMLSNFPIELFLSSDLNVVKVMGPKQQTEVLGMLIDEDGVVPQPPAPRGSNPAADQRKAWRLTDRAPPGTPRRHCDWRARQDCDGRVRTAYRALARRRVRNGRVRPSTAAPEGPARCRKKCRCGVLRSALACSHCRGSGPVRSPQRCCY